MLSSHYKDRTKRYWGREGGEREREQEKETSSLTLHFTNFLATLMVASQKAPLYLALTSVPTVRNGGSSEVAYNMFITRRVLSLFQPTPANCISTKVHSQPTPKIQYTLYIKYGGTIFEACGNIWTSLTYFVRTLSVVGRATQWYR